MTTTPSDPLSYMGIDEREQPRFIKAQRIPTTNDKVFAGTQWQDTNTGALYITQGEGVWTALGASGSSISTLTGDTGGAISPTAGNINIMGSGGISVAGAASTLTISSSAALAWIDAATTTTMAVSNGYIVTAGAQVFTLPATSAIGDSVEILLNGGTSWQIAQAAGQSIVVNAATTTVGAGGSITTTGDGQSIKLICIVTDTKWQATSLIGNPTVV